MSFAVAEALACSDELAERLTDPKAVWPDGPPDGGRFWPQSLASGAVGIALLHV
jgi:lantibiotic biosynthesis protein